MTELKALEVEGMTLYGLLRPEEGTFEEYCAVGVGGFSSNCLGKVHRIDGEGLREVSLENGSDEYAIGDVIEGEMTDAQFRRYLELFNEAPHYSAAHDKDPARPGLEPDTPIQEWHRFNEFGELERDCLVEAAKLGA